MDRIQDVNSNKNSNETTMIVTFGCSKKIHIFKEGCGATPVWPYKLHASIEAAKKYLEEREGKLMDRADDTK